MYVKVTDCESGNVSYYEYSRENWAKRWACMRGDLVVMWTPTQISESPIRTSGRIWQLVKFIYCDDIANNCRQ